MKKFWAVILSVTLALWGIPAAALATAGPEGQDEGFSSEQVQDVALEEGEPASEPADVGSEGTVQAPTPSSDQAAPQATAGADQAAGAEASGAGATSAASDKTAASKDKASNASDKAARTSGKGSSLKAQAGTEINNVSITVTPPEAGTHSTNATAAISTSTPGLSVAHAYWHEFKGYTSADPAEIDFVEGNSYYVVVCLDVADGYTLKKGAGKPSLDIDACDYAFGGDTSVSGGTLDSAAFRSAERYGSEKLYIWAKATATAGSAQTVNMRVWTEGHGKVLVNGSDYGTEFQGTWYEGTEVEVQAVPDADYKLNRWWVRKDPGPNAIVNDAAITLVAGTDLEARADFALETASVTITPPAAGTTAATAPQITLPDGAGYSLDPYDAVWHGPSTHWVTSGSLSGMDMETLDESTVFEPGQTYYAYVRLADGADSFAAQAGGSTFDTDLNVTGGTRTAQGNFAATSSSGHEFMGIEAIIAVTIPEAPSYDLTFEFTNVGTSAPLADLVSSVTVNGEDWPLPTSGMEVTKPIPAGSSVTATLKTAPGAMFNGAILDNDPTQSWGPSQNDTTLEIAFTMPEDNAVVEVLVTKYVELNYDANGGTKGPAWPGDTVKYPDYFASMITSWVVDNAPVNPMTNEAIVEPPAGAKYAGLEITDKNGAHSGAPGETISGLDFTAGATFKYLWEKQPTLTLHWSSIDGVDLADPIVIKDIEKGTQVYEALDTIGLNMMSRPFEKEGYIAADYKVKKPITEYTDYDAMDADWVDAFAPIDSDMDIYCIMLKALDKAEISLKAPVCGTEVTGEWNSQTNPPQVTIPNDAGYRFVGDGLPAYWVVDEDCAESFVGTIEGGQTYFAEIALTATFGYTFAENPGVTVPGTTSVTTNQDGDYLGVVAAIKAVHDPADPVKENVVEPTCTKAGSHDEVVYCKHCKEKISTKTVEDPALGHDWGEWKETKAPTCTDPGEEQRVCKRDSSHVETREVAALGHDWGEWKVVKEPTDTTEGLRQRTCSRCDETESEVIPKLTVSYYLAAGDGQIYTLGSNGTLQFTFKRNVDDAVAFSHFTGIKVDGTEVASSNYDAKSGSAVVTLKSSYLEKLSVGDHVLTASFDDGNDVKANFKVKAAEKGSSDTSKKSGTSKSTPSTGDQVLPLASMLGAMAVLALAAALVARRLRGME